MIQLQQRVNQANTFYAALRTSPGRILDARMITARGPATGRPAVYPRVYGEPVRTVRRYQNGYGLSPRVRGTRVEAGPPHKERV